MVIIHWYRSQVTQGLTHQWHAGVSQSQMLFKKKEDFIAPAKLFMMKGVPYGEMYTMAVG